jgi:hypothetical protein
MAVKRPEQASAKRATSKASSSRREPLKEKEVKVTPQKKVAAAKSVGTEGTVARGKPKLTKTAGPMLELPDGSTEEIDPSRLLLDPENLRLLERLGHSFKPPEIDLYGQSAIQKKLFDVIESDPRFDIQALSTSIANNGFLKHERLIVVRYDGEKYLVLEGNRRLTAVRKLFQSYGPDLKALRNNVRDSLKTLPCFVIDGPSIIDKEGQLEDYRRAAEIYIGMRHLMGAKSWEPASRYEFQSRLIFDEGWSIDEVADRFGRKKSEVLRDLKAQVLYKNFVSFEKRHKIAHSLTYNAFAEAARAPAISKWLGWSARTMQFEDSENIEAFFRYLISRIKNTTLGNDEEENADYVSAEVAVRRLREMVALDDAMVLEALADNDFANAEILFEEKKQGALSKKIASFTRTLKRATSEELEDDETLKRLIEMLEQVKKSLRLAEALAK